MPSSPRVSRTLNIGVLAHVDAGKTSLTERLLYDAGVIDRLGSVDAGDTQTDTGEIERRRGITVRTAVASLTAGDTQINLIDTPGHSDFIAEVERALGVLDGAVLVLSAVEGVQAQTRVLMKTLRRLRLPVLLFINKIDRAGARDEGLLADIRRALAPHLVPLTAVRAPGTRNAHVRPRSFDDPGVRAEAAEVLAEIDDAMLARVVDGPLPSAEEVWAALAARTAEGLAHPVFFGSALSGAGVADLVEGVARLVPPAPGGTEPRGTVFAVERGGGGTGGDRGGARGGRTAYLRLFSGEVTLRQRVTLHRREPGGAPTEHTGQITALEVIGRAGAARGPLTAGNIARVRGVSGVRVGDRLGPVHDTASDRRHFAAPSLQTLVRAREPGATAASRLHTALLDLADQDPLIHARAMPGGATSVLLYGEVQKEIIAATLVQDYGIEADFEPSRPVLVERPSGVGEAVHEIARFDHTGLWATVGLRVEPTERGAGAVFGYETELGALPRAFHNAIEETVYETLLHGLRGRSVTDCRVVLVRSGFIGPLSTAADFRDITPVVLGEALERAGWRVYEPYHAFELELPAEALAAVTAHLAAAEADIGESVDGATGWLVRGELPARRVHGFEQVLPRLTHGEGVWWSRPCADRPLRAGAAPGA
ncbi:tetracycline resistance ribosomal protection protein Otr(A) [Streptomyces sp. SID8382]|uniref:tetracycline resistance ribosomal protection protein Otr(A) n=1 Tax=Streptomyces malaysiensis TaxID=92644 RepID=UPI000C2C6355|nr:MULTISPECIES: tetracycline resistance ribosomal protection protein Otr(A) [unclassified Streptomyces]AUA11890.1 Tetracycline resistance protein TetM [Streptomyces sp. M56]MYX59897.1 tetracycline resistance ribosomal protection protein Otr(A) [Streptomyces sp. SID8382]